MKYTPKLRDPLVVVPFIGTKDPELVNASSHAPSVQKCVATERTAGIRHPAIRTRNPCRKWVTSVSENGRIAVTARLSLQVRLSLFKAEYRRGLRVNIIENDPLVSLMCQNH